MVDGILSVDVEVETPDDFVEQLARGNVSTITTRVGDKEHTSRVKYSAIRQKIVSVDDDDDENPHKITDDLT